MLYLDNYLGVFIMAIGFVLFFISSLILLFGLILIVLSIILFKKKKLILAIISLVIGLIITSPIIYMNFQFFNSVRANNRSQSMESMENIFVMEYTKLNEEFIEMHNSSIQSPIGIYVGVEARINGKGKLLIIPQPYDENRIIQMDIEGETNSGINSRNWNTTECIIHFIPESEFIEGKILLNIRIY